jgi:hypothetical protein
MQWRSAEREIGSLWISLSANSSAHSALKIPASYIEEIAENERLLCKLLL